MKTCPMCAESIQDAALKCRYCGTSFIKDGKRLDLVTPPSDAGKYSVSFWNPATGETKSASWLLLGTFLIGPFYLLFMRMGGPALKYFLIVFVPALLSLLLPPLFLIAIVLAIYLPFRAEVIVRKHYLDRGWLDMQAESNQVKTIAKPNREVLEAMIGGPAKSSTEKPMKSRMMAGVDNAGIQEYKL